MTTLTASAKDAFGRYVRLLQELHRLIAIQSDDSDVAEDIRTEMDSLWYSLTRVEQDRIGGLSEDLYILAEGGAKRTAMSKEEKKIWAEEAKAVLPGIFSGGDVDAALNFLRRPGPDDRPKWIVPFLQSRCWERLGQEDLAILFMKEAERLDPEQAVCVLILLEKYSRTEEALAYSERIVANPNASAAELYMATSAIDESVREGSSPTDTKPALERLVAILSQSFGMLMETAPPSQSP